MRSSKMANPVVENSYRLKKHQHKHISWMKLQNHVLFIFQFYITSVFYQFSSFSSTFFRSDAFVRCSRALTCKFFYRKPKLIISLKSADFFLYRNATAIHFDQAVLLLMLFFNFMNAWILYINCGGSSEYKTKQNDYRFYWICFEKKL